MNEKGAPASRHFTVWVIVAALASAFAFPLALPVHASPGTPVSGLISQDTTWTLAESPYEVIGNVGIDTGVTLTVQPGVRVEVQGNYKIQVAGRILAQGTENAPITFTCQTAPGKCWQGIEFVDGQNGSMLNYIQLGYTTGSSAAMDMRHGSWSLTNSRIHDNSSSIAALWLTGGVGGLTTTLSRNYIDQNVGTGVNVFFALSKFDYNTITANGVGVQLFGAMGDRINNNNIFGNTGNNADACFFSGDHTIDATNNWWGTTDAAQIAAKICDRNNDLSKPRIEFEPFQMAPVSGAATLPAPAPSPSPSPTPTPSPSPTPTASPTPTPIPPDNQFHQRRVGLQLRGPARRIARGRARVPDGFLRCARNAPVRIQRRVGGQWRTIRLLSTNQQRIYRARLPNVRARFRAIAPRQVRFDQEGTRHICRRAVSPIRRR